MPRIETLIDAYVDANIILIIGFLVWSLGRATLNRTRFGQDHLLHLRLTEGMILAAIISPILAALLARAGAVFFPGISLSAADIALAQFLNGHVAMKAQDFEAVLTARQAFIADLVRLECLRHANVGVVAASATRLTNIRFTRRLSPWSNFRKAQTCDLASHECVFAAPAGRSDALLN